MDNRKARRKKALIFLTVGTACLVAAFLLHSADIYGGAVAGILGLGMLVGLLGGLGYMIGGFFGKQ